MNTSDGRIIRMKFLCFLLPLMVMGCAVLSDDKTSVACQAADTVSTVVALEHGATELNPIMAGVISNFGYVGFFAIKALFAWWLTTQNEKIPGTVATVNVATCAISIWNFAQ